MPGTSILLQVIGIAIAVFVLFLMAKGAGKAQPACPKCKQALPEKSLFCPKCGAKLAAHENEK
ncbi:MAG: zinc ribbon domain-containing protein [archaeon]